MVLLLISIVKYPHSLESGISLSKSRLSLKNERRLLGDGFWGICNKGIKTHKRTRNVQKNIVACAKHTFLKNMEICKILLHSSPLPHKDVLNHFVTSAVNQAKLQIMKKSQQVARRRRTSLIQAELVLYERKFLNIYGCF